MEHTKHTEDTEHTELKRKSDLHMIRKLWHASGVSSMVGIYYLVGHNLSLAILIAASIIVIPFDILRQSNENLNRMAIRIFGPVMRRHEISRISGTTYLFIGGIFLLLFADKHILTLTLLFLAFGDPVASFFGIRFGKDKIIGHKTLQGTVAAFAICTVVAMIYYYSNNLMTERLLIVAPLSGLIGALSELIPIGKLDDNFTFPVICSTLLWALFHLFGGFGV